jgi:tetratricopeptide (TPR) repeat protein
MRRRLDVRFLFCLVAAVLVAAVGVHLLHGYQVRRNAGSLLRQATRAEEQKHLDQAARYLRLYLSHEPGNTDALARYGLLLERLARSGQDHEQAFLTLEQVLRRDPSRHDVRRKVVPIAMRLGWFSEAMGHLEHLLHDGAPHDAELERLLGQCHLRKKEFDRAAACFDKAIQDAPEDVDTYVWQADLLRRQLNQPKKAEEVMDALVGRNPKSAGAYLARARYRKTLGRAEEAAADVSRAQALAPEDGAVLLALARAALDGKVKDFDTARRHLRRALELHPQDAAAYQALAALEMEARRRPEAVACLRRGVQAVAAPDRRDLLWALANLLAEDRDDAPEAIDSLARAGFPAAQIGLVKARLLVTQGEWLRASKELERIRPDLLERPDLTKDADLLLGECYRQLGDADEQYAAYRRALNADPTGTAAAAGLASALVALGKLEQAVELYRQLAPAVPGVKAELARLLLLRNARLPKDQRQWEEVEGLLREAAAAEPDRAEVAVLRAEALALKGDVPAARALLVAERDRRPGEVPLWTALAGLEERYGNPEAALALLGRAEKQLGERVELRLARAAYLARRGDEGRPALARLAEGIERFAADDQAKLLRGLAEATARAGDAPAAERLWAQLAGRRPNDLGVRLVLFDAALQAGDDTGMQRVLKEVARIEGPEGTLSSYGEACRLIRLARGGKKEVLPQARALLTRLAARRPAWSRVPVCEAEIDELRGDHQAAIRNYQRAVNELGDQNPATIRRLVQLLYDSRRYVEAGQVLRQLPEEASLSGDWQRLSAAVCFETNDLDRAISLARKAVADGSRNYRDYIWLGLILSRAPGHEEETEQALRRAIALGEGVPDPWVALVHYLASKGEKDRAEAVIDQARGKLGKDAAPLALAHCYEATGRTDKADELYRAALAGRPDDVPTLRSVAGWFLRHGPARDAQVLLRRLIDLNIKSPEDAAWARRLLAVVLAAGGDYQQSRQALVILGILDQAEQPAAAEDNPEDQRARAMVLAAQRGRKPRRSAIALLEKLAARQPLTGDDQFLLAQLYDATGDWPRARQQMLGLLAADGDRPEYLASFAAALLAHQDLESVPTWLDRLRRQPEAAGTFAVASLQARLTAARGLPQEAVAVLTRYAAEGRDAAGELSRRAQAAALLEELGRASPEEKAYAEAAEALYGADAAARPDRALELAGFLGRQGRAREALDVCERALGTSPPEAVLNVAVAALQGGQPDAGQYRRAERWLEAARARAPEAPGLLVCAAYLRDLEGQPAAAAALYRQVLAREPGNGLALNNLALLLAQQQHRGAEALELIRGAIDKAGPLPELLDTRAVVYLSLGQKDLAIADLEEALEDAPQAVSHFHLAQAYALVGRPKEAQASFARAVRAGLKPADLAPPERPSYERFVAQAGPTRS